VRRLLRKDPSARRRAASILLDPSASANLRQALALVFGTFDGEETDRTLLSVLQHSKGDAAMVRCALLALGGTREPEEDDDVFGLGDRPWGEKGPGGIGITVRREIGDAATRIAMEGFLGGTDPAVREAAAEALRHTVAEGDVRDAFLDRLPGEPADEVAQVLGETLAGRAGLTPDETDRRAIVEALVARAGEEGLDGYRFRMEDDLQRVPLESDARRALERLAGAGHSFAVRSFALTALAGSASRSGPDAEAGTRSLLVTLLGSDPDPAVRDLAARLLHRVPYDAAAAAALAKAARQDAAWNVRFTAAETLAGYGSKPGVAEALDTVASDPDARVAGRARELRAKLVPK
jgi:HEAT repeat protein